MDIAALGPAIYPVVCQPSQVVASNHTGSQTDMSIPHLHNHSHEASLDWELESVLDFVVVRGQIGHEDVAIVHSRPHDVVGAYVYLIGGDILISAVVPLCHNTGNSLLRACVHRPPLPRSLLECGPGLASQVRARVRKRS